MSLRHRLPFGSASVEYERTVAAGDGLGGITQNDSAAGRLLVMTATRSRSGCAWSYRLTTWLAADADHNRVSFGLQIGYPLRFD